VSIETGIVAHLQADGTVSGLVGTRIYPMQIPQEATLPALAYQVISGRPTYSHGGDSGPEWCRVQITCHAGTYEAVKALAAAVRAALSGAAGAMDDVTVQGTFVENDRDGWGGTFELAVVRMDVVVWYE